MNMISVLILGAICGLAAAIIMNLFMRAVGRSFGRSADMVRALGSFCTGKMDNAKTVGTAMHCVAGISFGMIYLAIMQSIGALTFPHALFLGLGMGFAHGLVMSYVLMIFASEKHPLEDYRKATMREGVLHFVGHLIFGLVTGLLGGLIGMIL